MIPVNSPQLTQNPAPALPELLRHLDAQRASALALIESQNRLLAAWFQPNAAFPAAGERTTACAPAPGLPSPEKGKVVSLFDYARTDHGQPAAVAVANETDPSRTTDYRVFKESDLNAAHPHQAEVEALVTAYSADEAMAFKRQQLCDTIFLSSSRKGLFFHRCHAGMLFALPYVGALEDYAETLAELIRHAESQQLQLNLMAQDMYVAALKDAGFSTTPMGIWQTISPLADFTLEGQAMRRLRYLVNKYQKLGQCRTVEYIAGTDPATDQAICAIVDLWFVLKEKTPPMLIDFKDKIVAGTISKVHRIFLTYRDDQLDNALVFSRDNLNDGYLMDLEFYAKDVPLGSTEFALTEIIKLFNAEGRHSISLGATLGTELFEHENGSKEVYDILVQLKTAGYQDGDSNAQYKSKFRPNTAPYFIARPRGSGRHKLNELIFLFGS